MANAIVRTSIVYVNGLKVKFAKSNTYDLNTNNQAQVGVEGYLGHSRGANISKLDFDEVVPTSRLQSGVLKKFILPGKDCTVTYSMGGETLMFEGCFEQATFTGESMNGTLNGKFTIVGGKPQLLSPVNPFG